jgi:hypothetical protein
MENEIESVIVTLGRLAAEAELAAARTPAGSQEQYDLTRRAEILRAAQTEILLL